MHNGVHDMGSRVQQLLASCWQLFESEVTSVSCLLLKHITTRRVRAKKLTFVYVRARLF